MLEYIKYQRNLSKRRKTEDHVRKAFDADLKNARENGKTHVEIRGIESDMQFELSEISDDIQELASAYIINIARRHFTPFPALDNEQMWVERYGYRILSTSGINFIREKRAQQKAQAWSIYGSVIGATTGLVGAFAAVLALLK